MTSPPDYAMPRQQDYQSSFAPQSSMPPGYPPGQPSDGWEGLAPSFVAEPAVGIAAAYGQQMAQHGKEQLDKYISISGLKRYFDVDNQYVGKKLMLIACPFLHQNWSHSTGADQSPRTSVNVVDLYIPTMAVITYIFVSGCVLGIQNRFSPEQLGLLSSATLAWLLIENIVITGTRYAMVISETLSLWDTVAFSGYKYVGMIASLLAFLLGGRSAYICCLIYFALAVSFLLARSLKVHVGSAGSYEEGKKRKLYLLLYISLTQPLIMWWLTRSLTAVSPHLLPSDPLDEV